MRNRLLILCAIIASTEKQAEFFLETVTWQLDTTIHSFFEAELGEVRALHDDEPWGL
jgi:hypothetical protein